MVWFIIITAVAVVAVFLVLEVRSWKKPSTLPDSYGNITPGLSAGGQDLAPRGLKKPNP